MNSEKFDPKSPKFNWTALAQRNQDTVNQTIKEGKDRRNKRADRMQARYNQSDRHQAAMYALDKKLRGSADKYSLKEIIRGELGQ